MNGGLILDESGPRNPGNRCVCVCVRVRAPLCCKVCSVRPPSARVLRELWAWVLF